MIDKNTGKEINLGGGDMRDGMRYETFLVTDPVKPHYAFEKMVSDNVLKKKVADMNAAAKKGGRLTERPDFPTELLNERNSKQKVKSKW